MTSVDPAYEHNINGESKALVKVEKEGVAICLSLEDIREIRDVYKYANDKLIEAKRAEREVIYQSLKKWAMNTHKRKCEAMFKPVTIMERYELYDSMNKIAERNTTAK